MSQYTPNKEELEAIRDNDPDYFDAQYSNTQKQSFLYEGVARGKMDIIKHFIEQRVTLANNTCIDKLAEKKKKIKVFEYLKSQGIDISPRGNIGLLRAAMALSIEHTDYLAQFTEKDHNGIKLTLICIIKRDKSTENKTPLKEYEPILKTLLYKCSSELLKTVLNIKGHNPKDSENNTYVADLFLKMDNSLEEKSEILNNAVEQGQFGIIKLYMENGIEINRKIALLGLSKTPTTHILEYLENKNVDLTQDGHALLLQAIKDKNSVVATYLAPKIENNEIATINATKLTIENFLPGEQPDLFKTLLEKISSHELENILNQVKDLNKKTSIFNLFLSSQLNNQLRPHKVLKI